MCLYPQTKLIVIGKLGSASKVWLINALEDLNQQLDGNLIF